MDKRGINLLKKREDKFDLKSKIKTLNLVGILSLLVYFCVFLGTSFYGSRIEEQGREIGAMEKQQEKKIKALAETEILQLDVKTRLSSLVKIFPQQVNFKKILDYFGSFLPEEVKFKSISITEDGSVVLGINTKDSLTLEQIEEVISSQKTNGLLESAKLNSISRDEKGGYNLNLSFKLKSLGFYE